MDKEKVIIDLHTLFKEAEVFYNTTCFIFNNFGIAEDTIAYIVNNTFACELYFKFLLYKREQSPWGHSLKDLYSNLPYDIKQQLDNSINQKSLNYCLTNFDNGFENYRYYYERTNSKKCKPIIRFDHMNTFIIGLRTVATNEYNNMIGYIQ